MAIGELIMALWNDGLGLWGRRSKLFPEDTQQRLNEAAWTCVDEVPPRF